MFVDDVNASAEHRLNQITHTLKHVYDTELTLDESTIDELAALHDSSEIVKNSIVSESAFNSWHSNPVYTKHMLIMEAVRLYLTEIAPKRRPRHLRESEETALNESHATKVGRWMMDFAEKANTKDDKLLAMLNSFGRVGEDLVRLGQPFSPKSMKDLVAYYEARVGDTNDDQDDRRQAKENLMALRMGHKMYDKHHAKKTKESAPVEEETVAHMADAGAEAHGMDPELAALMKKYGVSAGHEMDEEITDEGNEFTGALAAAKAAHKDEFEVGGKTFKVNEQMTSRIAQALNEEHMQHHDYQASMARSELYRNAKYGMDMLKMVRKEDEIEPWIASCLTKAAMNLDKIYHYMDYYQHAEPGVLGEDAPMADYSMDDEDMGSDEELGETSGSIARMNLLEIVEYSIKLFQMIQPGDHLEGWVAMKLTKASEGISSSKHFLDYKAFERHAGEDVGLEEGRYGLVARILREAAETPEQDLQQAQTLIAAKSISDDLQSMAEKVARMGVDDLMPLVDTMKTQFGPEAADAYNEVMKKQLEDLLQSVQTAKDQSDDAVLALQGGGIPGAGGTDIENVGTVSGAAAPEVPEMGDGTGTMPAAAGGEEPLGRAKKPAADTGAVVAEGRKKIAEKWGTEMHTAEKDKGKWDGYTIAELKAKKKKLMDKEERSAAEQKTVKQIDFAIRAKQKDKFGKINEDTQQDQKIARIKKAVANLDFSKAAQDTIQKVIPSTALDDPEQDAAWRAMSPQQLDAEVARWERLQKQTAVNPKDNVAKPLSPQQKSQAVSKAATFEGTLREGALVKILAGLGLGAAMLANWMSSGGASKDTPLGQALAAAAAKGDQTAAKELQNLDTYIEANDVNKIDALKDSYLSQTPVKEAKKAKPDFLDVDKDGNKKEPMKKALKDKAKKIDEAKSKSPYAIGMWQAKKAAGMDPDKPAHDLPKKVVKKAHEIGASIEGTDESIKRLGGLVEKALRGKRKYEADLAEHRAEFAQRLAEGKVKDLLKSGQGLDGDLLEKKIAEVTAMAADLNQQIRVLESDSKAKLLAAIKEERKAARFATAKATKPWGVMYESQGKRKTKFFEDQKARDYWAQLNSSIKTKLINPEHFDRVTAK